jgi:hypothetical protein
LAFRLDVIDVETNLSARIERVRITRARATAPTSITIPLEDLVSQLRGNTTTHDRFALYGFQEVLSWPQVVSVDMGSNPHPLFVAQFPDATCVFADSSHIADLPGSHDFADIRFEEASDAITGAQCISLPRS